MAGQMVYPRRFRNTSGLGTSLFAVIGLSAIVFLASRSITACFVASRASSSVEHAIHKMASQTLAQDISRYQRTPAVGLNDADPQRAGVIDVGHAIDTGSAVVVKELPKMPPMQVGDRPLTPATCNAPAVAWNKGDVLNIGLRACSFELGHLVDVLRSDQSWSRAVVTAKDENGAIIVSIDGLSAVKRIPPGYLHQFLRAPTLQVGDMVDVLRSDGSWSPAAVCMIMDDGTAILSLDGGTRIKRIGACLRDEFMKNVREPTIKW